MCDRADQLDGEAALGRHDDDAIDQAAQDPQRLGAGAWIAECLLQILHLAPIYLSKVGVQPRR